MPVWLPEQLDRIGTRMKYLRKYGKLKILLKDLYRLIYTGQVPFPEHYRTKPGNYKRNF